MERYLAFENIEIGNADRVGAYIRRGLAGPDAHVVSAGGCTCQAMGGPFVSPTHAPAQWY